MVTDAQLTFLVTSVSCLHHEELLGNKRAPSRTYKNLAPEVIKLLNSLVLPGLPMRPVGTIIPIDSEETGFRESVFCFLEERVSEYGIIECDGFSAHLLTLRYLNGLHPKIAGVHENSDSPHIGNPLKMRRDARLLRPLLVGCLWGIDVEPGAFGHRGVSFLSSPLREVVVR